MASLRKRIAGERTPDAIGWNLLSQAPADHVSQAVGSSSRLERRCLLVREVTSANEEERDENADERDRRARPERRLEPVRQRNRLRNTGSDVVRRGRDRDRREDRDADRAADLLRRVDQSGCETGLVWLRPRDRRDRDRHERERHAEPDDEEAREQVGPVRAVDRDLREVEQPDRHQRHPEDERRLDADARDGRRSDVRPDDRRAGDRQVAEARLERAQVAAPAACTA